MKCRACNYEHENIHSNIPFKRLRMFGKDSEIEFYTDGYNGIVFNREKLPAGNLLVISVSSDIYSLFWSF